MLFLIDENLPKSIGTLFIGRGIVVEYVSSIPTLQGEPDEALFDYAIKQSAIIVTRDVGFASFARFPLHRLAGCILIRFPNQIGIQSMGSEITRLIDHLKESDYRNLIIIEPGIVRTRNLEIL